MNVPQSYQVFNEQKEFWQNAAPENFQKLSLPALLLHLLPIIFMNLNANSRFVQQKKKGA